MRRTFGYMALSCLVVLMAATNSRAENTCNPSKWGENDEIGSANLVTPDQVLMAVKLVKKGKTHPLGIVIEPGMPAFAPRLSFFWSARLCDYISMCLCVNVSVLSLIHI